MQEIYLTCFMEIYDLNHKITVVFFSLVTLVFQVESIVCHLFLE
jgi:hypothetical protein